MTRRLTIPLGFLAASAMTADAVAPDFVANFEATLHGFDGGSAYANPATGGVADSGYLEVATTFASQLGARTDDADLVGDYDAAGVTGIRLYLNDTGADDALEIHVAVGESFSNVWQYDTGFAPPNGSWAEFQVDLTDGSGWTQIIGSGTFADAKANTDRLLIRHDVAPYGQFPDSIQADFGVDRIVLEPVAISVPAAGGIWLGALAFAVAGITRGLLRERRAAATT